MASEVCGFVRQQPFTAAALMGGIGLLIGLLLGRRWEKTHSPVLLRLSPWRSALRLAERGCFVRPRLKGAFGKRPFFVGLDVLRPIIRDAVVRWWQKADDAVRRPGNAHSRSGYRFANLELMRWHGCYPDWSRASSSRTMGFNSATAIPARAVFMDRLPSAGVGNVKERLW